MKESLKIYKNASVLLTGLACFLMLVSVYVLSAVPYVSNAYKWASAVTALILPIFCVWLGGLFRSMWETLPTWFKICLFALIPAMYAVLVFCPSWSHRAVFSWPNGYDMLLLTLCIMGFLTLPEAKAGTGRGWLSLVLFLAAAFCFVGVTRVSDHFALVNYTLRDSEWTKLFTRSMKAVPLMMAMFFLQRFAMSEIGQKIGSRKWVQWVTLVLIVLTGAFVYYTAFEYSWRHGSTFMVRWVFTHPLTVFLIITLCLGIRKLISLVRMKRGRFS